MLNEFEAERTTGIQIVRSGAVDLHAARRAARELLKAGVREWVVIHFPVGAVAAGVKGNEMCREEGLCLGTTLNFTGKNAFNATVKTS